jgi:hypothetical protein
VKVKEVVLQDTEPRETDDLFEMANLFPRTTGLPMTVWVSPRGNARHDARIKVNLTYGNQMNPANTAVVEVRPSPQSTQSSLVRCCSPSRPDRPNLLD